MATPLDKAAFLAKAPLAYAVGIVELLRDGRSDLHPASFESAFQHMSDEPPLMGNPYLLKKASQWLIERGLINFVEMDFGPDLIERAAEFHEKLADLAADRTLPFYGYRRVDDGRSLVIGMLNDVLEQASKLGVTDADYQRPPLDRWVAIPLEREDRLLTESLEASSNALGSIEASNGYAVEHAEERAFVIAGLTAFIDRLKTATSISLHFVEQYGLRPLRVALPRFKKAAEDTVIRLAIEAVKTWLRSKGFYF